MPTIETIVPKVPLFAAGNATVQRLAQTYMHFALGAAAGYMADEAPVNAGHLSQSFLADPATQDGGQEILNGPEIGSITGRVFSALPYAIVMDQGRRPGEKMPPVAAIELWVQRQLGIATEKERRKAAWAIAIAIHRKGIKARNFAAAAIAKAQPTIDMTFGRLSNAIGEALTKGGHA